MHMNGLTTAAPVVLCDDREKGSYTFAGLEVSGMPIRVERTHLQTGDYTLPCLQHLIAVERKSALDLHGTLSTARRRRRFQAELQRLSRLPFPLVLVEATQAELQTMQTPNSRFPAAAMLCVMRDFMIRYVAVRWLFVPGRRAGEIATVRFLADSVSRMDPQQTATAGVEAWRTSASPGEPLV